MNHFKKLGRKPATSPLLSGDRAIDELRLRGILLVNGRTPRTASRELNISESAVSKFLKIKARSSIFFRYLENLAKTNDVIVKRSY